MFIYNLPILHTTNINEFDKRKWFHIKKILAADDISQQLCKSIFCWCFKQIKLHKPNPHCTAHKTDLMVQKLVDQLTCLGSTSRHRIILDFPSVLSWVWHYIRPLSTSQTRTVCLVSFLLSRVEISVLIWFSERPCKFSWSYLYFATYMLNVDTPPSNMPSNYAALPQRKHLRPVYLRKHVYFLLVHPRNLHPTRMHHLNSNNKKRAEKS